MSRLEREIAAKLGEPCLHINVRASKVGGGLSGFETKNGEAFSSEANVVPMCSTRARYILSVSCRIHGT